MTALADNKEVTEKETKVLAFPVGATFKIFKGAICKLNAAGYLAPQSAEAAGFKAGIAIELVDNSAGANGALWCQVLRKGTFLLTFVGLTQADLGSIAYASDDQTVSATQAANEIAVGTIVGFESATSGWVEL
jgi:hypothetical protein